MRGGGGNPGGFRHGQGARLSDRENLLLLWVPPVVTRRRGFSMKIRRPPRPAAMVVNGSRSWWEPRDQAGTGDWRLRRVREEQDRRWTCLLP